MSTAVLFPGQGSQAPGMRSDVERWRPDLLEAALAELGDDLFERVDESTALAQPAIYCASLAGWARLGDGVDPGFLAGHSLGELSALAAAGALDELDGLRLVALRGRLMERAGGGRGGMLALRVDRETARRLAEPHGLAVANDNSPEQVVLSGDLDALERAAEQATDEGLGAKRLPVAAAFHSPAMAPARAEFEVALAGVDLRPPRTPVVSCVTAAPVDDPRARLAEGLTEPVRWRDTLLTLHRLGARRFVEVGPGRALTGLVRRTLDGVEAATVERLEAVGA